ncbi:cell filamentation protein Fic [Dietzia sp. UCD-THP]|uniref:Fic family protein n=1 Tax=Dietzia sp. UCD-THP TaxID=1292020 RepID=UPI000365A2C2|nr:Fic family protein [Dietzia sp. UCD-THP]EYT64729.1 cell filamentation protein Fic [Dietzia sp. UCD-THP]
MTRHPATSAMLAISALEGWRPEEDDDEILDLVDSAAPGRLIRLHVRNAFPPEATRRPRPRILARRTPYLIRGTSVLENSLGLTSARALGRAEALLAVAAGARLLRDPAHAPRTVSGVHAALFCDVYPWAGLPRIVGLSKQGSAFAPTARVAMMTAPLENPADLVADALSSAPGTASRTTTVAIALANWYARFNYVHPFREGNGRAAAVAALLAARAHGVDLDFTRTDRGSWVQAAVSSMPVPPRRSVDPTAHRFEFLRVTMDRSVTP